VSPTDSELVTQALGGGEAAYRELVARHATAALNLIARLVRDRALAEDLTQDAFIRAFERLATFDKSRNFSSWFLQVAHNVAVDYIRRKRVPSVSLDLLSAEGYEPAADEHRALSPHAEAERRELAQALERGLAVLRPEYRAAIVLHYQQGLGHADISAILGVPIGTVKTYLHRGRKEMADLLARQGWDKAETLL